MKRKPILWTLRATLAAVPLTACAWDAGGLTEGDTPDEGVSTLSEAASTYLNVAYWDSEIEVCFIPIERTRPNGNDVDVARPWHANDTLRSGQTMTALRDSWSSVANLTFSSLGQCASTPPSDALKVRLVNSHIADTGNTRWGTCGNGKGTTCTFGSSTLENEVTFSTIVIHEVGHGLGLAHEHQRSVMSNGVRVHEVALCPSEAAAWAANPSNGDLTPEPLNKLTLYDRCSIMNYCNEPWGCVNEGPSLTAANLEFALTPYDALGAEILYPHEDESIPLACSRGCLVTGTGVVVRSNGRIRDSWSARGANPWWKTTPSSAQLTWWDPAGNSTTGSEYDPAPGSRAISFVAETLYTSADVGGTGIVTDSDTVWTALALSVL